MIEEHVVRLGFDSKCVQKKKKCKLPHVGVGLPELLIDGETSLPPSEESIDVEESNVDTAVLLASISSRDVSRIRFIALGRELIFDYKCDDIWESWYCKRKSKTGVMIPQKILNCIVEDEEGEIEEGKGDRLTVSLSQQSMRILLRVFSSASIAFCVIKYLNNNEVLYFSECSKRLRNSIFYENRDPEDPFRRCLGLRLKEAISFQNSKTKGEMSAMKKMEKKKKSKQSHLKLTDKKDAFARRGMFS